MDEFNTPIPPVPTTEAERRPKNRRSLSGYSFFSRLHPEKETTLGPLSPTAKTDHDHVLAERKHDKDTWFRRFLNMSENKDDKPKTDASFFDVMNILRPSYFIKGYVDAYRKGGDYAKAMIDFLSSKQLEKDGKLDKLSMTSGYVPTKEVKNDPRNPDRDAPSSEKGPKPPETPPNAPRTGPGQMLPGGPQKLVHDKPVALLEKGTDALEKPTTRKALGQPEKEGEKPKGQRDEGVTPESHIAPDTTGKNRARAGRMAARSAHKAAPPASQTTALDRAGAITPGSGMKDITPRSGMKDITPPSAPPSAKPKRPRDMGAR